MCAQFLVMGDLSRLSPIRSASYHDAAARTYTLKAAANRAWVYVKSEMRNACWTTIEDLEKVERIEFGTVPARYDNNEAREERWVEMVEMVELSKLSLLVVRSGRRWQWRSRVVE